MSRTVKIRSIIAFIAALVLTAVPATAFATDISVTSDSTSVKVGDTVTVTITVSAEHIASANGVFTYDPALLSFISGSGGASDGHISMMSAKKGGASSLTAVVKFKALSGGTTEVYVTIEKALSYDEQSLESAEAGVGIAVTGSAAGTTGSESEPPADISLKGVAAKNVKGAKDDMYVWRSLSSLTLPAGFFDKQVTYNGEYVNGAAIPDSEDFTLLYLSDKAGDNAGYYVYDQKNDVLFPYLNVVSVYADFTLIWPDESVKPPAGFEETTLSWKKKDVPAWTQTGSGGTVYLIYARDSSGETGFFLYNSEDKSVQRFMAPSTAETEPSAEPAVAQTEKLVTEQEQKETSAITVSPAVLIAAAVGCAVLVATAALFAVLYIKASRAKRVKPRIENQDDTVIRVKDADI